MGAIGIFRGLGKVIEGIAEGDIAKVGKGVVRTAVGVTTTLFGFGGDDASDNSD